MSVGINLFQLTGFVLKHITLFESKKGTPACRFQIASGETKFTFIQDIVIYGSRAIEISKTVEVGDLVFASGQRADLTLPGRDGYRVTTPCLITNLCYILETKEQREQRHSS